MSTPQLQRRRNDRMPLRSRADATDAASSSCEAALTVALMALATVLAFFVVYVGMIHRLFMSILH